MTSSAPFRESTRTLGPVSLQVLSGGTGDTLLVLHDIEYVNAWHPFLERLARDFHVVAPSHPGFGASSLPDEMDSVDDLAYVYLDLLRDLGQPVHLVGLGLGGWIAAEVAIRCSHHLRSLTLVDAVGIKVGDRFARDIADTFIIPPQQFLKLAWHDPKAGESAMRLVGLGTHEERDLVTLLRNRQSAALLTWKPFMHHPRLRARLARVDVPTLVLWGESDRVVSPEYGRAYAAAIPGAAFEAVAAAGHYPYLEQPDAFVAAVTRFARQQAARPATDRPAAPAAAAV